MSVYDFIVIGSGPAGKRAAVQAAKLGKRVCIIEKNPVLGGAGINTGTIPSKALREAVLYLSGANKRVLYGDNFRPKRDITIVAGDHSRMKSLALSGVSADEVRLRVSAILGRSL